MRILILDDLHEIGTITKEIVDEMGHEALVFSCGKKALDYIRVDIDLVITDIALGDYEADGVDGFRIAEKARRLGIPVMAHTGSCVEKLDGFDEVANKPNGFDKIISFIKKHEKRKAA